jgi:hypothetical protein
LNLFSTVGVLVQLLARLKKKVKVKLSVDT